MIYYTIYKTTNKINGKYYIGKHKTSDPFDNYMGSGTLIRRAISRYGIENFEKEILDYAENDNHLNILESEYVSEDVVNDPNCYNMKIGGYGGFDHLNKIEIKSQIMEIKRFKESLWSEEKRKEINYKKGSSARGERNFWYGKKRSGELSPMFGKQRTQETKDKNKSS